MTKQQAQVLCQLTAQPQWAAFVEVQLERLNKLRDELETVSPERLQYLQGQVEAIKKTLNLRKELEDFLNRNKD